MIKFFAGFVILLLALSFQFLFASAGIYFNFTLAALIAMVFVFEFWELLILDLIAVFILNWQPAPSLTLILFMLIPLGAYAFRKITQWQGWIGNLIATFVGFLIFYVLSGTSQFLANPAFFFEDLFASLIVGQFILLAMS